MEENRNYENYESESENETKDRGSSAPILAALALGAVGGCYAAVKGVKWVIGKGKGAMAAAKAKKEEKKAKKEEKKTESSDEKAEGKEE